MACETVIAPAPIAITVRAAATGVVRPNAAIIVPDSVKEPIIAAVVVIATVEEPCAVFKIAAIKMGRKYLLKIRRLRFL